ncbi:transketolase, partial [Candidatus Curtissbacteria bacterium]|nr:transketolase [Candidatus Curtissbacteria bacterium]
ATKSDKLTIIACGVTLAEAIKAADELSREGVNARVIDAYCIKPLDEATIRGAASETNNLVVTVEDHYPEGGLGDAVLSAFGGARGVKVYKLAVCKMPISGKPRELLDYEGISANSIVKKVRKLVS